MQEGFWEAPGRSRAAWIGTLGDRPGLHREAGATGEAGGGQGREDPRVSLIKFRC